MKKMVALALDERNVLSLLYLTAFFAIILSGINANVGGVESSFA